MNDCLMQKYLVEDFEYARVPLVEEEEEEEVA
jgi:hypothetical protein